MSFVSITEHQRNTVKRRTAYDASPHTRFELRKDGRTYVFMHVCTSVYVCA